MYILYIIKKYIPVNGMNIGLKHTGVAIFTECRIGIYV